MRILLVVNSLGRGGAENVVSGLADKFAQRGHEVKIVVLLGLVDFAPSEANVTIENLGLRKNIFSLISSVRKLYQIVDEFRPDVANSHLFQANILLRLLRIFANIPLLISSAHNTNEGARHRMLAYRATDRLADISTNVSIDAVNAFVSQKAVKRNRMVVIHNGIDTCSFAPSKLERENIRKDLGIQPEQTVIMAVGRLEEQKDYPNLLKAIANSLQELPTLRLIIVGEGPLRAELEDICRGLGLENCVKFLGLRRDVAQLLSACDIFVLSSAWEGFPLVIGEAMSCGKMVVATDVGGVREWLPNSRFVVPRNDPDALGRALVKSAKIGTKERNSIGKLHRERVKKHYGLEAVADNWLNLYERLINEKLKSR